MAEKKQESFVVNDRRLFTSDGEVRAETVEEKPTSALATENFDNQATDSPQTIPPPPSSKEQQAQAEAYRNSSQDLDRQVEQSGHSAKELEMTFERFMASLYMTAMMQLGLMHEQGGQPQIDIIGARQTIDTISLLSEKTKGNLSPAEGNFMQTSLYELRMAYVEVTNALAHPPQAAGGNIKQ
ncbi:MAG TPA: DUF1844 domain-containing protein [Terriglobales bacterium]|jgi:hypothetical protein